MGVDHGGSHVVMAQKLPDRSDVVTGFEQVSGKGMPEGVASSPLGQTCLRDGISDGFLNERFVNVMAALFLALGVYPPVFLWKDPFTAPVLRRVGILAVEGVVLSHSG